MNKNELKEILNELAEKDLQDGADIHDHPCQVAIRAIDQCFDDINSLKSIINTGYGEKSKRMQSILKITYNPEW